MSNPVLGHRIILRPEAELEGRKTSNVVAELLKKIPVMNVAK
jgi:MoxR-like ATPase